MRSLLFPECNGAVFRVHIIYDRQGLQMVAHIPDDEIRAFLAGNLCRCSGYDGQLRGIRAFLDSRK